MRRSLLAVPIIALLTVVMTIQPAAAKSKYKVTGSVSDSTITQGQEVTVSGHVSAGTTSSLKVYQKQPPGSWALVDTVKPKASGAYKTHSLFPRLSGPAYIKIVKPASSTHSAGSKTVSMRVFGWVPLSKLPGKVTEAGASSFGTWTDSEGWDTYGALRMRVATGTTNARVRFDLKNQCTTLSGSGGLDNSSHGGELARVRWFTRPSTDTSQTALLGPIHDVTTASLPFEEYVSIKSGSARPRQLVFSVQMSHASDLFGYDVRVLCNLPGAKDQDDE